MVTEPIAEGPSVARRAVSDTLSRDGHPEIAIPYGIRCGEKTHCGFTLGFVNPSKMT
jgi:hypothetical protein